MSDIRLKPGQLFVDTREGYSVRLLTDEEQRETPDQPSRAAPRKRQVIVSQDYLDGIEGVSTREPSEYDETVREIDVNLIEAYERTAEAAWQAEDALWKAWCEATDVPNPGYVDDDEVTDDEA